MDAASGDAGGARGGDRQSGAGKPSAGKRRLVKGAMRVAAKTIVRGTVGMYDLGAVTSCVGLVRHREMRTMLDRSRLGAEKAVSNLFDGLFTSAIGSSEDPVTSILLLAILAPMTIPMGLFVGVYAFMVEVCIGTIQVAGIPGILFYAGLRVLEHGRPKLKRKIMRVCRGVGALLIGMGGVFAMRKEKDGKLAEKGDGAPFYEDDDIFQ